MVNRICGGMISGGERQSTWGVRASITVCVITTCKDHKADRPALPTQPLLLSPGQTGKICLSGNKPIAVLLPRRPSLSLARRWRLR